jgi:hypothetical protein
VTRHRIYVCFGTRDNAYSLLQSHEIMDLQSDQQLFRLLKVAYKLTKGSWAHFFGLSCVTNVQFAKVCDIRFLGPYFEYSLIYEKFEVSKGRVVSSQPNNVPPLDRHDYFFLPRPPIVIPPVAPTLLKHLLMNPNRASKHSSYILNMIPKRQYKEMYAQEDSDGTHWGLYVEERPSILRVILFICSTSLISAIFCLQISFGETRKKVQPQTSALSTHLSTTGILFSIYALIFILAPVGIALYSKAHGPVVSAAGDSEVGCASNAGADTGAAALPITDPSRLETQGSAPNFGLIERTLSWLVPRSRRVFSVWQNLSDSFLRFCAKPFTGPRDIVLHRCVRPQSKHQIIG